MTTPAKTTTRAGGAKPPSAYDFMAAELARNAARLAEAAAADPAVRDDVAKASQGPPFARLAPYDRLVGRGLVAPLPEVEEAPTPAPAPATATTAPAAATRPGLTFVPAPAPSQGNPRPGSTPQPAVNAGAEQAVLALALADGGRLDREFRALRPEHFFERSRSQLFAAMRGLREAGGTFDGPTLVDALVSGGRLPRAEAVAAVSYVQGLAPAPSLASRHAEIVLRDAAIRDGARAVESIRELGTGRVSVSGAVEALRDLIDRIDPSGDDWREAPPADAGGPAPFPLASLPPGLAGFVAAIARSIPCPPDFVALPCLAVASVAVGRSLALRVKPGYTEEANLWLAVVGRPGTAKTPAIKAALAPLYAIQEEELHVHRLLREALAREATLRRARGDAPRDDEAPPLRRCVADDMTFESLGIRLRDNPRGLLIASDEISGFISGMNQYKGGGNDLQNYLKLWGRVAVCIDRKGQEGGIPIFLPDPFVSVVGGVQPDLLAGFRSKQDDGFSDRFLFSFPAEVPIRFCREVADEDASRAWDAAVRRLWEAAGGHDERGRLTPHAIPFAPEAFERFVAYFDANAEQAEAADFPAELRGPWAKLRTYAARLALLCEALSWAYGRSERPPRAVGRASVDRAVALCEYFGDHFRRVVAHVNGQGDHDPEADAILAWIRGRAGDRRRFTGRQVRDNFRRRYRLDPEALDRALSRLERRGLIRRADERATGVRQPGTGAFEVHPSVVAEAPK